MLISDVPARSRSSLDGYACIQLDGNIMVYVRVCVNPLTCKPTKQADGAKTLKRKRMKAYPIVLVWLSVLPNITSAAMITSKPSPLMSESTTSMSSSLPHRNCRVGFNHICMYPDDSVRDHSNSTNTSRDSYTI